MTQPTIDQQITFLYTRDLSGSATFYEDVLGLPLVLDQGGCRIYRVAGEAFLGICQRDPAPDDPDDPVDPIDPADPNDPNDPDDPDDPLKRHFVVTMVTEDVDAMCAALEARGGHLEQRPTLNPRYGIYHAFLRDPNGYLIEIQRFVDPRWPR